MLFKTMIHVYLYWSHSDLLMFELFHAFLQVWQRVSWREQKLKIKNVLNTFLYGKLSILTPVKFQCFSFSYTLKLFCLLIFIIHRTFTFKIVSVFPHPFKLKDSFTSFKKIMCAYWPFWLHLITRYTHSETVFFC